MNDVALDIRGLSSLIKALKGPQPVARIGILGGKVQRTEQKKTMTHAEVSSLAKPIPKGDSLNNAEIGAIHEFGDVTHPKRSFLRVPLADHITREMEKSHAFTPEALAQIVKAGTLFPWIQKIGVLGEKIVLGAFASGGYGKWAAWSKGYTNNTGDILVDSTQLRGSITHEIVVDE